MAKVIDPPGGVPGKQLNYPREYFDGAWRLFEAGVDYPETWNVESAARRFRAQAQGMGRKGSAQTVSPTSFRGAVVGGR